MFDFNLDWWMKQSFGAQPQQVIEYEAKPGNALKKYRQKRKTRNRIARASRRRNR